MRTEQDKAVIELEVFRDFIEKAGIEVDLESVQKTGAESEPDIFCTLKSGEQVAYELVEICSPDIAATPSKLKNGGATVAFLTSDPTEKIIRSKLGKNYRTSRPIELICYTNGRTVSPDDQIIDVVLQWANAVEGPHPFKKIWLLGEMDTAHEVWSAPQVRCQTHRA